MRLKQTQYSKHFSDFYDTYAHADSAKLTQRVNDLLNTYNPNGTKLLELGCGTGMILEGLPKRYEFWGLDISKHMIAVAKKKFPKSKFYVADMSTFQLDEEFDVIICFSDSLNHLPTFSAWKKTFQRVFSHLKKNGVFIFDMNTLRRLERLSAMPIYTSSLVNNRFFTVKVTPGKKSQYFFSIQIFTLRGNSVSAGEDTISESSFPIKKVKQSLEKNFRIKKIIDVVRPRITKHAGKVIFVCKKRQKE